MTNKKYQQLKKEILYYMQYDKNISKDIFDHIINNNMNEYEEFIYNYFYSHINSNGEIISIERFLKYNKKDSNKYLEINNRFINNLFKNNKPLFFFDVDNTITDLGVLSKEKEEYLKNFKEKDRIVLSTGKAYESISDVVSKCNLDTNIASCINGSILVENKEHLMINGIKEVSKELIKEIEKEGIEFTYYYTDGAYATKKLSENNVKWMNKYNETYTINKDIEYDKVIKLLLFIFENEYKKEEWMKKTSKKYKDIISVRTGHHCVEFLRKDQHKGNTVKIISEKLGRYYRCSIGVGDSMNDFRMLDYVGKAFIVDTSSKELSSFGFKKLEKNRNKDIINLMEEYK